MRGDAAAQVSPCGPRGIARALAMAAVVRHVLLALLEQSCILCVRFGVGGVREKGSGGIEKELGVRAWEKGLKEGGVRVCMA